MLNRRQFIYTTTIGGILFTLGTLAGKFKVLRREPVDYDVHEHKITDQPFDYAQDFKDYFNSKNSLLKMTKCESIKDPAHWGDLMRGLVVDRRSVRTGGRHGRAKYYNFLYYPDQMIELDYRKMIYRESEHHIKIEFQYKNRGIS